MVSERRAIGAARVLAARNVGRCYLPGTYSCAIRKPVKDRKSTVYSTIVHPYQRYKRSINYWVPRRHDVVRVPGTYFTTAVGYKNYPYGYCFHLRAEYRRIDYILPK